MSKSYYNDIALKTFGPVIQEHGSHMIMSGVQKNLVEHIVTVDTLYNTSSNDTVFLAEKITGVKQLEIDSVSIPYTFYNITAANNTMTVVKQGGATLNLVLTPGYYASVADLVSAINTLLAATYGSGEVVFSILSITKKTIITCTANYMFTFNTDASACFKSVFSKSLGYILGFRENLSYGNAFASPAVALLMLPRHIYLTLNEWSGQSVRNFSAPTSSGVISNNIICKISVPTGLNFGSIINASPSNGLLVTEVRKYMEKINVLRMELTLVDESGIKLDLNGADFIVALRLLCE
jgi:hypothetical protein